MLTGYRTYISLIVMAIYNIVLPWLGIKDISMDTLDTVVNVILLIAIAVFHKLHKPKV